MPGIGPVEPADVEPGVAPVVAGLLIVGCAVGLVVAAGLATVTAGALAVAVSVLLPVRTDTVALNLMVSPPGADFGTLTSASICGVPGSLAGSFSTQLVLVGLLVQLSTVKTGLLNAGVFAPGVSVVAIVPPSAEPDQAEILNSTVLPGRTLLADAVTASKGFVGAGVLVPVGVGVGVGVVLVDGVGVVLVDGVGVVLVDGVGVALVDGVGVTLVDGVGVTLVSGVGMALVDGVGDVTLVAVEPGLGSAVGEEDFTAVGMSEAADEEGFEAAGVGDAAVLDTAGVADALVADGAGVAVGVVARAVPVTPLEITKRPVARPSVTGRACADRMRTPCLSG